MVLFIKKILFALLPTHYYLLAVSFVFIRVTKWGFYKSTYPELFYLKHIIKQGDTVIDIGANLGYYATKMAELVGKTGKVLLVEPMPHFQKIALLNTKKYAATCELIPYALGSEEGIIGFENPLKTGSWHHGRTKIASTSKADIEVQIKKADSVFKNITTTINFVKCDVEGHEIQLLLAMIETIKKHKPILQIEIENVNKEYLYDWFKSIGYACYVLFNFQLKRITKNELIASEKQDFYFLFELN